MRLLERVQVPEQVEQSRLLVEQQVRHLPAVQLICLVDLLLLEQVVPSLVLLEPVEQHQELAVPSPSQQEPVLLRRL
jgi:hypothetical protein